MAYQRMLPAGSGRDQAELVASELVARRELLLRAYRGWLPREDLEDCLAQAAMELVLRARRKPDAFTSPRHARNALEQKYRSRICDRLRARSGRSAAHTALARALPLEEMPDLPDPRADTAGTVASKLELRGVLSLTRALTEDQWLALFHEVFLQTSPADFCARYGWSEEKRRKVLQRARQRLRHALRQAR